MFRSLLSESLLLALNESQNHGLRRVPAQLPVFLGVDLLHSTPTSLDGPSVSSQSHPRGDISAGLSGSARNEVSSGGCREKRSPKSSPELHCQSCGRWSFVPPRTSSRTSTPQASQQHLVKWTPQTDSSRAVRALLSHSLLLVTQTVSSSSHRDALRASRLSLLLRLLSAAESSIQIVDFQLNSSLFGNICLVS